MPATCEVWLEEHSNIIRQRLEGSMTRDDFARLTYLTDQCTQRLPPGVPVRILADGRRVSLVGLRTRRDGAALFHNKSFRLAIYGAHEGHNRLVALLISIVAGRDRMRFFETEDEARGWLLT